MPKVTMSSTGHYCVDIRAIANFDDDISIGKRTYSRAHTVYKKRLKFKMDGHDFRRWYALAKHINSDCDSESCTYCKNSEY